MATEQRECRICLATKNDSNSGFSIDLNSSNVFQPFQQILLNLTGIDVFENKDISSWICDQCENKLVDFDRFRKKCCESNDVFLKRAVNKTILNEKPKETDLSLLERLDRLHVENIKIQNPVKVDLIEEETDSSENDSNEEQPDESELKTDSSENDSNEEQPDESELSLLERLEKNIHSRDEKLVDPVKVALIEEENNLSKNALKPLKNQPSFEGYHKFYSCPYCTKYFQRDIHLVGSLMEHLNTNHPKVIKKTPIQKNECTICNKVLIDQIALDAHMVSSHIKYCCEKCNGFFRNNEVPMHKSSCLVKKDIEVHKQDRKHQLVDPVKVQGEQSFQRVYICLHCPIKFQSSGSLLIHLFVAHPTLAKKTPIGKNECKFCYKVLGNQMSLTAHIESKHIQHCCNKCKKYFRDNEVQLHEKTCQKTKPIKNMEANKHVVDPDVIEKGKDLPKNVPLVINQSIEEFQKVYVCLHCTNTVYFGKFESLIGHLKNNHHNLIKKTPLVKNECQVCYKVLLNQMALESHIASSHVKQRCNKCLNVFFDAREHQKTCPILNPTTTKEIKIKSVEKTTLLPVYSANCRTCLVTKNEGKHFIDILQNTFYPEIFLCCTGIDIKTTPRMTTWMCGECETKLTGFYNFQRKCWESDLVLRKIQK